MKIGIDIRSAGGQKAGKGWFTFNIARGLLKIDHHNEYILYTDGGVAGFEEFKNVEMRIVTSRGLFWHRAVSRDVVESGLDYFIAPSSYIVPSMLPASTKVGAPKVILVVHDLVAFLFKTHQKKAALIERLTLKKALKKAYKVTADSENTAKDLHKFFEIEDSKILIVPCAASDEYFPIEKNEGTGAELASFMAKTGLPEKFFFAVGTIEPRKNYETLIQAFTMIHEKYPDQNLVIVGGEGWGRVEIEKMIRENYLQKHVHLLGYLTNKTINKLYNLAQALVFPSFYEGFGLPPLEAMKAGCPVLVSDTSSVPEVVGDAGLYFDPTSPSEIASAMEKIVLDNDGRGGGAGLRVDLINKGRIQAQKFNWEESASKILDLIVQ